MSAFDIIGSIGWALTTAPIPRGSVCTYGAMGNAATCTIQGSMLTLGLTVPPYNAMLSIYFLMVIKLNMRDRAVAKYEKYMHIGAVSMPLLVTIVGVSARLFNNYSHVCWLSEKDHYRAFMDVEENDDGKRKDYEEDSNNNNMEGILILILVSITLVCAVAVFSVIAYCMKNIYFYVKEQQDNMNQYRFPRRESVSLVANNETTRTMHNSPLSGQNGTTSHHSTSNSIISQRNRMNSPRGSPSRSARTQTSSLAETVEDTKIQAYSYVCSFLLSYLFTTILIVFEMILEVRLPYPIIIMQAIFAPLQGFWNFLIYIRPRLKDVTRSHPHLSFLRRLYVTIFRKPNSTASQTTNRPRGGMGVRGFPLRLPDNSPRPQPRRRRSMIEPRQLSFFQQQQQQAEESSEMILIRTSEIRGRKNDDDLETVEEYDIEQQRGLSNRGSAGDDNNASLGTRSKVVRRQQQQQRRHSCPSVAL